MIEFSAELPVYVFSHVTDMRKGFDSLARLVREYGGADVLDGGLFVFFSRRRDRVKVLAWDDDGFALFYKRLEAGVYRVEEKNEVIELSGAELRLILQGMELERIKLRNKAKSGVFSESVVY